MDSRLWQLSTVSTAPRLMNLTLQIEEGVTAVVGNSGAGKTSLLNLLVDFERPDSGTVTATLPESDHALPLFWVPQNFGLWPHLNVLQHLEAVAPREGTPPLPDLLAAFDLENLGRAFPDQLAEGERARLSVARALAAQAAVLVMDEPFSHVDPARIDQYWGVVRDHLNTSSTSLVFATHSPRRVLAEAGFVVCLSAGRLLFHGAVGLLYHHPPTEELAACLGEGNWLSPEEASLWLEDETTTQRFFRPEQLEISLSPSSPTQVISSRFQGVVSEVELEHTPTGKHRNFFHRPASPALKPGDHVVLKVLCLLLFIGLIGCGNGSESSIPVQEVHTFMLPPDHSKLPAPRSLAVDGNSGVVVLDTSGRVLVFSPDRTLLRWWRMPRTEAGRPEGVCILEDGRIAVADTHYHQVLIFDPHGSLLTTLGKSGREPGAFVFPVDVAEDDTGNLYVCEYGSNDRVQKFDPEGTFLLAFGRFGTGPDAFQRPSGLLWHKGKVYVADAINNRIQVFTDSGRHLGILGRPGAPPELHFPYDIAMGPGGAVHVVEYGAGRVSKLSLDGRLLGRFDGVKTETGRFRTPWGIAVDSRGAVLVADTGNRRIVELKTGQEAR